MNTFISFPLWASDKCDKIVERVKQTPCHEALSVVDDRNQLKKSFRHADMYDLGDPALLEEILESVLPKNDWGFELGGGLPSVEVLRYKEGGHQAAHTDWGGIHNKRKLSFSIQLSPVTSDEGGEFVLYDGPAPWMADSTQGTITIFPSWTLHQVQEVASGERWSAVGWILGKDSYA